MTLGSTGCRYCAIAAHGWSARWSPAIRADDHVIFVGSVECIRQSSRRPLVFGGGQYLVADPHDLGRAPVGTEGAMKSQPHAVRLASRAMLRLAHTLDKTLALVAWGNHGPTVIAWQAATTPVAADLPLGLVLPVTSSASGLALAAFLPPEAVDRFVTAELRDNGRQRVWRSAPHGGIARTRT